MNKHEKILVEVANNFHMKRGSEGKVGPNLFSNGQFFKMVIGFYDSSVFK